MNNDEVAALAALQRNLGWKILVREFQNRRTTTVDLLMNPDTSLEEVERGRLIARGIAEVLAWPKQTIDMYAPVDQMIRAGTYPAPEEE